MSSEAEGSIASIARTLDARTSPRECWFSCWAGRRDRVPVSFIHWSSTASAQHACTKSREVSTEQYRSVWRGTKLMAILFQNVPKSSADETQAATTP